LVQELIRKGLAEQHAGRLSEAKHHYEQVLALEPRHPDALNLLGVIALQRGDAAGAVTLIEKAIQAQPSNPGFHANLAQAYLALQRIADAHSAFRRAARLDPRNPQFAVGVATCLALQGSAAEAEHQLRRVAQEHPEYPLAWYNLGNVLRNQGRPQEAADSYRRAIRIDPTFADAHNDLGQVLHQVERFDDAEQAYRQYLALQPDSATGYFNLASLLVDRGRAADAVTVCREGIERCHGSAGSSDLQWMLGSALAHQGNLVSALVAFRTAAVSDPNNSRALWGCGVALLETGNEQEGLRWLERTLELDPDSSEFRHAMAGVYLSVGDIQAGWQEYQRRPARGRLVEKFSQMELAREARGNLSAKSILLLREQGLGDELFFLRFTAGLKSRGAVITYRANAKLGSLLARVPQLDRVITADAPLPAADLAMLVGDLPWLLGRLDSSPYRAPAAPRTRHAATTLEVRFHRLPRVFHPELPPPLALAALPEQLRDMKQRLAGLGPPPYQGLTWRAGTAPEQQRGTVWMLHKEIPLELLGAAVRGVPGTLLALQRNPQPGEIEELSARAARPVHDLTALNEDLEAMLALLALIDDYIGVSNTNMHLRAGASRTACVLVPRPAEWRWFLAGDESPWFPGFRIYRQGPDGDWSAALGRLRADLLAAFGNH